MVSAIYRRNLFRLALGISILAFSCSKDDTPAPAPPPVKVQVSIAPITDSIRKQPITFQAIVDHTPDSYKWEFGDGAISAMSSPQHTYNEMGNYDILLTVTLKGVSSYAQYKLPIKADGRINGSRHFSGHYSYSRIEPGLWTSIERDIADTIITFTWPKPFQIGFLNTGASLRQDTGSEVWYSGDPSGPVRGDLKYYPANDSIYIKYLTTEAPGYAGATWNFWSKK